MRIASYLLTIGLFGITAMGASLAEEVGAGAHSAGNVSTSPAEPSASQHSSVESAGEGAAKLDGQPQAHNKGGETGTPGGEGALNRIGGTVNSPGASGPNDSGNDVIDTRIGMPSRRLDGRRNKVENVKARVKLLAPRRPSTPAKFDLGMRNAIGVPLTPHGGQEQRDSKHRGVPSIVPNSSGLGAAGSTKAEGHVERPALLGADTGLGLNPGMLNRATINGTGATHLGVGQHSIGGPAKAVAGISGSTVHSKH